MIRALCQITGLAAMLSSVDGAKDILIEEMVTAAKETAQSQSELILSGKTPDGAAQKQVTEGTEAQKRKKGIVPNVPLYRTGRLADPSAWLVRKTKAGATVKPPKDRQTAVAVLRTRGFRMVFDILTKTVSDSLEKRVATRLGRL